MNFCMGGAGDLMPDGRKGQKEKMGTILREGEKRTNM